MLHLTFSVKGPSISWPAMFHAHLCINHTLSFGDPSLHYGIKSYSSIFVLFPTIMSKDSWRSLLAFWKFSCIILSLFTTDSYFYCVSAEEGNLFKFKAVNCSRIYMYYLWRIMFRPWSMIVLFALVSPMVSV